MLKEEEDSMRNIILIAPPAAGKGTQSKLIEERYGIPHVSTGDLLREAAKKDEHIRNELKLGHLINDDVTLSLLKEELKSDKYQNGYILDGFPRNLYQAYKYDEILKELNLDIGVIVVLELSYEEAKNRILGRLLCSNCGAIYNETEPTMIPKTNGICDKCGHDLYKRSDDNEETFKKRYQTYLEQTEPIIKYYETMHHVHYIESINIDSTFDKIKELIL
jgi:adenylate kinase